MYQNLFVGHEHFDFITRLSLCKLTHAQKSSSTGFIQYTYCTLSQGLHKILYMTSYLIRGTTWTDVNPDYYVLIGLNH